MSEVVELLPHWEKAWNINHYNLARLHCCLTCSAQARVSLAAPQAATIWGPGVSPAQSAAMVDQWRKVARLPAKTSPWPPHRLGDPPATHSSVTRPSEMRSGAPLWRTVMFPMELARSSTILGSGDTQGATSRCSTALTNLENSMALGVMTARVYPREDRRLRLSQSQRDKSNLAISWDWLPGATARQRPPQWESSLTWPSLWWCWSCPACSGSCRGRGPGPRSAILAATGLSPQYRTRCLGIQSVTICKRIILVKLPRTGWTISSGL